MEQNKKSRKKQTDWGVLYFSGTGNTKYCAVRLAEALGASDKPCALEQKEAVQVLKCHDDLIFAYPVQYSNLPDIVRTFIVENHMCWRGKRVFLMATMGAFSGDGTGVAARLLKRYGAVVTGGVHIQMPDSVADVKTLIRPDEKNRQIVAEAGKRVQETAKKMKQGKMPQQGLGVGSHLLGLFGQRLYFWNAAEKYKDQLTIDTAKCIACGHCVNRCPRENLVIQDGRPKPQGKCTMCYRCISECPSQAITLIGKEVIEQIRIDNFI